MTRCEPSWRARWFSAITSHTDIKIHAAADRIWFLKRVMPYRRAAVLGFLPYPDLISRPRVRRAARGLVTLKTWPGMEATSAEAAQLHAGNLQALGDGFASSANAWPDSVSQAANTWESGRWSRTLIWRNWPGPLVDCLCSSPAAPDSDADAAAWRTNVMTASALRSGRSGGDGTSCFGYANGSAAATGQSGRRADSVDHVGWRAVPQALISIG
jgi:hypothetical protein